MNESYTSGTSYLDGETPTENYYNKKRRKTRGCFVSNTGEMLNIIDIQVNCSYLSETTNLALIEGLSLGIPSVVTNIGGNSQIVKDNVNGFIVPIQDPEKMAESIYLITKDSARFEQMKKEAKRIFEEEFNSKVFAQKIEEIYDKLT